MKPDFSGFMRTWHFLMQIVPFASGFHALALRTGPMRSFQELFLTIVRPHRNCFFEVYGDIIVTHHAHTNISYKIERTVNDNNNAHYRSPPNSTSPSYRRVSAEEATGVLKLQGPSLQNTFPVLAPAIPFSIYLEIIFPRRMHNAYGHVR